MQFSVNRMQATGIITVPYCSEKYFHVDHAARRTCVTACPSSGNGITKIDF